jgi:flagellar biogenesis protein FliO
VILSSATALLVLAGLVAVPFLLRHHRASAPDGVRVVGRTALHKNAVVAVLAVGDRRLLVGAGERGVQLLAELGDVRTEDLPGPDTAAAELAFIEGSLEGPGTGLIDRLRTMTVRTPETGRSADVLLRR